MNLAAESEDSSATVFVNFNQDSTSLSIGTRTGYKLYALNNTDKLDKLHEDDSEDICIVERLFSSSLVAIVSLSSPRKLKVYHFKKNTEICNYSYINTILAVKLNRQRLVVCLEESLYIHNIRDMKLLHTIRETPQNATGLCALSANSDNCYLAYPGNHATGEVQIFDALNLQNKIMIPAHDNPLAAIAFDSSGLKIATASEKGTVIRVFNVTDGQVIYEFRRGYARCVTIYSLSFSADSLFLCASSNTETVHIFKLEDPKESKGHEQPQSWMGYLSKAFMQSASYLPSPVTEMLNQWRSFAIARLPFSGLKNVCAITTIQKVTRVLIASADGYLYIYDLNVNEGGDCVLVKQHKLDETVQLNPNANMGNQGTMSYAAVVRGQDPFYSNINATASTTAAFPVSSTTTTTTAATADLASNASPPRSESTNNYDGEFPPMSYKPGF